MALSQVRTAILNRARTSLLPSTEIIIFPSTKAFRSDLNALDKGLGPLSKTEGLLSTHAGVQMQDPSIGYMINNFKTLDNFKQLISGPQFPEVLTGLKTAIAGPAATIHNVAFPFDITGALAKPITELAIINATTPEAKEVVKYCLEVISVATNRLGSYNSDIDKEDVFVFICGWESVEEFKTKFAETPALNGILEKMKSVATGELQFFKLKQFLPKY